MTPSQSSKARNSNLFVSGRAKKTELSTGLAWQRRIDHLCSKIFCLTTMLITLTTDQTIRHHQYQSRYQDRLISISKIPIVVGVHELEIERCDLQYHSNIPCNPTKDTPASKNTAF